MEIYLDANATTPVLPQAREAALSVMADAFGNPSSIHGSGLKARVVLDQARAAARRVLDAPSGQLLFTSGATEGIQTAVLSALHHLRQRRTAGEAIPTLLLYGATEHKAVPEALKHWNALLGLDLAVQAIPVGADGRHDLAWLRAHAGRAGLVCTMAANNETGVVSDLDGIAAVLADSPALWLVDGVQALGKLPLRLRERGIDYAPFSGHKLYAPKGIGLLYVRDGAPFTPLLAGGGQEGALRSGTENMAGIAALGAVLAALEQGGVFATPAELAQRRERLAQALREAFPGVVFNAAFEHSLPTTLNVSVPGLSARMLLDLFDAAGLRVSGGSACGASKAKPSYVLEAMGLPEWQTAAAVRLSFGAADDAALVDEACQRLRACGESLRATCQSPTPALAPLPVDRLTRFVLEGSCCYVLADATSRRCVVVDPLPELTGRLAQWLRCRGATLVAVLQTQGPSSGAAEALRAATAELLAEPGPRQSLDLLGWPEGATRLDLGDHHLTRLAVPGPTRDAVAYLLHGPQAATGNAENTHNAGSHADAAHPHAAFVGTTVLPGALGRSDQPASEPLRYGASLAALAQAVGPHTLLLPRQDAEDRFATTLAVERAAQPLLDSLLAGRLGERAFAMEKAELEARTEPRRPPERVEMSPGELLRRLQDGGPQRPLLVDVRESYEERMSPTVARWPGLGADGVLQAVPLSALLNALPGWTALPADRPLVFCCRSGNRSAQAARALRRLGHAQAWSLAGGLALWPAETPAAKVALAA